MIAVLKRQKFNDAIPALADRLFVGERTLIAAFRRSFGQVYLGEVFNPDEPLDAREPTSGSDRLDGATAMRPIRWTSDRSLDASDEQPTAGNHPRRDTHLVRASCGSGHRKPILAQTLKREAQSLLE